MKEMYFTLTGCNYYLGSDFLEKGMIVKLKKEPDNEYDNEAIKVKMKGLGKIGYVANSPRTVIGDCMSAGRLYDKISKKAKGQIIAVTDRGVICKVICEDEIIYDELIPPTVESNQLVDDLAENERLGE